MVIATKQFGLSLSSVPSKINTPSFCWTALWTHRICWATTDNTSNSIRLNSSKQAQAPEDANPLKNWRKRKKIFLRKGHHLLKQIFNLLSQNCTFSLIKAPRIKTMSLALKPKSQKCFDNIPITFKCKLASVYPGRHGWKFVTFNL